VRRLLARALGCGGSSVMHLAARLRWLVTEPRLLSIVCAPYERVSSWARRRVQGLAVRGGNKAAKSGAVQYSCRVAPVKSWQHGNNEKKMEGRM
jgi:hypothetical protein